MDKKGISFQIISITVLLVLFTIFTASCSQPSYWRFEEFSDDSAPSWQWETATPESQGIDSGYLVKMMEMLDNSNTDIDAVFIVRNGYKIFEAYNKPYSSDIPHVLNSVTKSVTSTLVGIAIDQGYIEGIEQPVLDLFKFKQGELKKYISNDLELKHLLTMSTGLDLRDNAAHNNSEGYWEMYESKDPAVYAFSRKKIHEPGEYYDYSNISAYMLGAVLDENIGMKSWDFADSVLFKPLGITNYKWQISTKDEIIAAERGLWLKAEDFAKFAWMIAQDGRWQGKQIVSEKWIKEATSRQIKIPITRMANSFSIYYGYLWAINDDESFHYLGSCGQYVIIDPEHNLAVIFLAALPEDTETYPATLYRLYIKPAVSDIKLPENPQSAAKLETLAERWERRLISLDNVPETLVPYLNKTYKMEENSLGIKSIKLNLEKDVLNVTFNYGVKKLSFKAGKGEYLVADNGINAAAVSYFSENRIEIRYLTIGNGTDNHFVLNFSGNELFIDYAHSIGSTGHLRGK